jgi:hypothetical protein
MESLRCLLGSLHNQFRPRDVDQTVYREACVGDEVGASEVYRLDKLKSADVWVFVGVEGPSGWKTKGA